MTPGDKSNNGPDFFKGPEGLTIVEPRATHHSQKARRYYLRMVFSVKDF